MTHHQHMTPAEQIAAVLAAPVPVCPNCEHGMDPHGSDPGGICGVGDGGGSPCTCLLTPSAIHDLSRQGASIMTLTDLSPSQVASQEQEAAS